MTVDAKTVLALADAWCWVEVDGEVVACDDRTGAVHVLTGSSAVVFARLDGMASLEQVATSVSALFGADRALVTQDVLRFASDLVAAGLVGPVQPGGQRDP